MINCLKETQLDKQKNNQALIADKLKNLLNAHPEKYRSNVLDVGCADLRPYSEFLIETFDAYSGIDSNASFVEMAKGKLKRWPTAKANILNCNAEKLTFPDNSFDVIVLIDMLAYTDKNCVLREMTRILKAGGLGISLSNNTIDYSFHKIFHPSKIWLVEFLHSLAVIVNTFFYKLFKIRIFHTTYNSEKEIEGLLKKILFSKTKVWKDKNALSLRTINFLVEK